jgi:F-type H+-transporting ATPase subunit epsilon
MNLEIVSPEKIIYNGKAELVTLPGLLGIFTILEHHAPVVSALQKGTVVYRVNGENFEIKINEGFVEAKKNIVSVSIE